MGEFIANTGAFFLLLGAVLIFLIFLFDTGIIKDKNVFKLNARILIYTVVIGMVYYFVIAYMKNTMAGKTNIFDFKAIFSFMGMDNMIRSFENPSIKGGFYGVQMPLYPYLVNFIGGIVFNKFCGTAVFLNFMGTALGMSALFNAFKGTNAYKLFYVLILPFAFLLFTPMGLGLSFGLAGLGALAFYNNKKSIWIILGILSVLINKFGILFLIPLFVDTDTVLSFMKAFKKPLENPYIKNSVLYIEIMLCAIIMFLVIGGVK